MVTKASEMLKLKFVFLRKLSFDQVWILYSCYAYGQMYMHICFWWFYTYITYFMELLYIRPYITYFMGGGWKFTRIFVVVVQMLRTPPISRNFPTNETFSMCQLCTNKNCLHANDSVLVLNEERSKQSGIFEFYRKAFGSVCDCTSWR